MTGPQLQDGWDAVELSRHDNQHDAALALREASRDGLCVSTSEPGYDSGGAYIGETRWIVWRLERREDKKLREAVDRLERVIHLCDHQTRPDKAANIHALNTIRQHIRR